MGPGYDPNADCPAGPVIEFKSTELRNRWIAEAVQLVVGIAYAYDVMKNAGSNVNNLLTAIQNQLEKIQMQLVEVNRTLQDILHYLRDLPQLVRGEMEDAQIKALLGEASQRVALISDYSLPSKLGDANNRRILEDLLNQLQINIGGIVGINALKGTLAVAPYTIAWYQGRVALAKWLRKNEPGATFQSPWEMNFNGWNVRLYQDLFDRIARQDSEYVTHVIKTLPRHNRILALDAIKGYFVDHPNPHGSPGDTAGERQFRFVCRKQAVPPVPEHMEIATLVNYVPGHPDSVVWRNLSSMPSQEDARSTLDQLLKQRSEVVLFYDLVPVIYEKSDAVMESFKTPAKFWDVND